jgi:hypothetical protein
MIHYLFDDIIYKYRAFFHSSEHHNSKFLYDICFGFRPQKFDNIDEDKLILDEEHEVTDMYFIQQGVVGIGYYLMTQGLSTKQFQLGIKKKPSTFICDYYVCANQKSEFIFIAMSDVECIALGKRFL